MSSYSIFSLLRFLASIIVVLFHFGQNINVLNSFPKVFIAGPQMVTFFFTLSGFFLTIKYFDKDNFNIKNFFIKRLIKIYPLYFMAIIITFILDYLYSNIDIIEYLLNILMLQSWFPPYPLSVNPPSWFVSTLIFLYMIFPYILKKVKSYNLQKITLLVFAVWVITQALLTLIYNSSLYKGYPSISHDFIYYFPISHLSTFLIGIWGAVFFKNGQYLNSNIKTIKLIFTVLFITTAIQFQNDIGNILHLKILYGTGIYAPLFILLILTIMFFNNNNRYKIIILLGDISYIIYILQLPIYKIYTLFYEVSDVTSLIKYIVVLIFIAILIQKIIISNLTHYKYAYSE